MDRQLITKIKAGIFSFGYWKKRSVLCNCKPSEAKKNNVIKWAGGNAYISSLNLNLTQQGQKYLTHVWSWTRLSLTDCDKTVWNESNTNLTLLVDEGQVQHSKFQMRGSLQLLTVKPNNYIPIPSSGDIIEMFYKTGVASRMWRYSYRSKHTPFSNLEEVH